MLLKITLNTAIKVLKEQLLRNVPPDVQTFYEFYQETGKEKEFDAFLNIYVLRGLLDLKLVYGHNNEENLKRLGKKLGYVSEVRKLHLHRDGVFLPSNNNIVYGGAYVSHTDCVVPLIPFIKLLLKGGLYNVKQ